MCGIFGFVDFRREGARGWDDGLSFAVTAISPRGPDEQNSLWGNVGAFQFLFAHSRLSVIDPPGVEMRLPFMDYRLVELALAFPKRLKIANEVGKWALRRITAGVLPDAIRLKRVKRGFDVTQSWIERGIAASLRERIQARKSSLRPHLRKNVDYDAVLSDAALQRDGDLLDEALMLARLAKPLRDRGATT